MQCTKLMNYAVQITLYGYPKRKEHGIDSFAEFTRMLCMLGVPQHGRPPQCVSACLLDLSPVGTPSEGGLIIWCHIKLNLQLNRSLVAFIYILSASPSAPIFCCVGLTPIDYSISTSFTVKISHNDRRIRKGCCGRLYRFPSHCCFGDRRSIPGTKN